MTTNNREVRRQPLPVENQAIAEEIRIALVNEALKLKGMAVKMCEQLVETVEAAATSIIAPVDGPNLQTLDKKLDAAMSEFQAGFSEAEQLMQQMTAALVEFRIRRRTVLKVVERFAGGETADLRITDSNAHAHLPAVRER